MRELKGDCIAVYGATGHTGRFVIGELLRRGFNPIAVVRRPGALVAATFEEEVVCRCATVDDSVSLDEAFEGAAAIINCAGPFLDTAQAVAGSAVRLGIHYLNVTAEQPSAEATLDSFDDAARQAGITILPAVGFYGGFADLLASIATSGLDDVDSIEIMIGLDSWHPTKGTRLTGERNTTRRKVVANGALEPVQLPPREREWQFAGFSGPQLVTEVPFAEVILIARHLKPKTLRTYLSANALRDVRDPSTPAPLLGASGRSAQRFVVEAIATAGNRTRRVVAEGRDIYAFSAPLICEALEHLLRPDFNGAGAHAPGEILDAAEVLNALQPEHLTLHIFND